jgi:hypothetical protein
MAAFVFRRGIESGNDSPKRIQSEHAARLMICRPDSLKQEDWPHVGMSIAGEGVCGKFRLERGLREPAGSELHLNEAKQIEPSGSNRRYQKLGKNRRFGQQTTRPPLSRHMQR